jgi:ferredoxin-NADP reductase
MTFVVAGKKQETPDTFSFQFKCNRLKTWKPGQYLHYTLDHKEPDSRGKERYFTIASSPFEGRIMLTTRFAHEGLGPPSARSRGFKSQSRLAERVVSRLRRLHA